NQGKITADNANGIGGNLTLNADSLILDSEASISASTTADRGQGGNIGLIINDTLQMRARSLISARADNGANGGNVNIDAELIMAAPNQNNDIIASAMEQGVGGNINITAEGVFGLEERSSTPANETNDIDASSEFGLDGTVFNLTEAIEPPKIVELQTLGLNACSSSGESESSSFELTGKGGVPPQLTAPLNSDAIFTEGESISIGKGQSERVQTEQIKPLVTAQGKIYPARGIVFLENGDILLTPYPTNTVQRTPYNSLNCFKS
ncbi:MAG: filamentous hemagglutinin, partial [Xenococcaceae cyanobacterium]